MDKQHPLTTEVNDIVYALSEHDGFSMKYKNCSADIIDDENDLGMIYIDNQVVSMYRYGGKNVWPFYVDDKLIKEMQKVLELAWLINLLML